MATLSELGRVLVTCRACSASQWQRAASRGAGDLARTLDALVAEPPEWWSDSEEDAPPGLTDHQRAIIEMWFEDSEVDLTRLLTRNQFLLLDKLGQGGQGEVFRARQLNPARFVAVKILTQDSESRRLRFEQEARAMMRIQHQAVARFYLYERVRDIAGKPTDEYLIAMEFVDGNDLSRLIDAFGPIPWRFVIRWAIQLLEGLAVIHLNDFIHRDIKPANVMILGPLPERGAAVAKTAAKLLDFGAVKPATDNATSGRRRTFIGTREYAPPEQWGEQTVPASDLYALGATLFQALTGLPPYEVEGRDAIAFMKAHTHAPIPHVTDSIPDVPEELNDLIRRMLAKDPEDRGTAELLAERFRELLPKKTRETPTHSITDSPAQTSKPAALVRSRPTTEPEAEPKSVLHAAVHPFISIFERIFLPSSLRPLPGQEPTLSERVATLLRRPLVLLVLFAMVVLLIYVIVRA